MDRSRPALPDSVTFAGESQGYPRSPTTSSSMRSRRRFRNTKPREHPSETFSTSLRRFVQRPAGHPYVRPPQGSQPGMRAGCRHRCATSCQLLPSPNFHDRKSPTRARCPGPSRNALHLQQSLIGQLYLLIQCVCYDVSFYRHGNDDGQPNTQDHDSQNRGESDFEGAAHADR